MELDNLKEIWKAQESEGQRAGEAEILSILQKKSKSPIATMKRKMMWELIAVVVLYSGTILYYFLAYQGLYWGLSIVLLVMAVVFVGYYYKKNKLLKEMECVTCEVRSNLQRKLFTLEKYVRFYLIAGSVLASLAYFVTGIIVSSISKYSLLNSSRNVWIFIIVGILLTVCLIFLNKWYVRKLYGQHISRLKALLLQTEEAI